MAQLGYYRIGRTLGGGTFGRVACTFHTVADHELTQQRVAIKILNRAQIHSGRMTRRSSAKSTSSSCSTTLTSSVSTKS